MGGGPSIQSILYAFRSDICMLLIVKIGIVSGQGGGPLFAIYNRYIAGVFPRIGHVPRTRIRPLNISDGEMTAPILLAGLQASTNDLT
ncbi:hypothetical protein PSPO01_09470 [Paraphaeosphaeria sporulosa]